MDPYTEIWRLHAVFKAHHLSVLVLRGTGVKDSVLARYARKARVKFPLNEHYSDGFFSLSVEMDPRRNDLRDLVSNRKKIVIPSLSKHHVSANMTHGHNGFMVDIELEGREPAHEQLDGGDAAVARGAVDHNRASHALKNVGHLKWLTRFRGILCSLIIRFVH